MFDTAVVQCPYCLEELDVYVDPETEGDLVRDCDVCCRPWALRVQRGEDGTLLVDAMRAQ